MAMSDKEVIGRLGESRSALPVPEHDALDAGGHAMSAFDAAQLADFFTKGRDDALRGAASLVRKHNGLEAGRLPDSAQPRFAERASSAEVFGKLAEQFRAVSEEHRTSVVVRSEPRTYGPPSPYSFYLDRARAAIPGTPGHIDAAARLERYGKELFVEARAGSPEGRRALRAVEASARDRGREAMDGEVRAMTTGSTSGAPFVTPIYLLDGGDYALYNSYPASVIAQSLQLPDPGFGLELYLPAFSSAVAAGQQSPEGSAIDDSTPTAGFLSASMVTFAGEVLVSQQLFDRSVGQNVGIDQVIHAALSQQLRTQQDAYVIAQMIAVGGTYSGASSFTAAKFFADVAATKAQMETAAGTLLRPSAMFAAPEIVEWLLSQSDPAGRPLLLPTAPGASIVLNSPSPGYTGYSVLGLPVFTDANVPVASPSYNAQIVLAAMPEVLTLSTEPVVRAYQETEAQDLQVVLSLYALTGTVIRHPNAAQVLTGGAYAVSPSYA